MLGCKGKVIVILMAVVLLVPALAGCVKEKPKEIQFGCALSLSGEFEEEGHLTKEGYDCGRTMSIHREESRLATRNT